MIRPTPTTVTVIIQLLKRFLQFSGQKRFLPHRWSVRFVFDDTVAFNQWVSLSLMQISGVNPLKLSCSEDADGGVAARFEYEACPLTHQKVLESLVQINSQVSDTQRMAEVIAFRAKRIRGRNIAALSCEPPAGNRIWESRQRKF
ncbi:hypothetical protein WDW37_17395 [Bdellovibrionota bacterium FG-1]